VRWADFIFLFYANMENGQLPYEFQDTSNSLPKNQEIGVLLNNVISECENVASVERWKDVTGGVVDQSLRHCRYGPTI
jgi:hypothetical protein